MCPAPRPDRNAWLALAGFVLVTFAAAALGSRFTAESVGGWYETLRKPSWNPPSWVFGPVWSALYLAMAIAAWLAWRSAGARAGAVLALYGVQLALNVAWSAVFFGLRRPDLALLEIALLWLAIAATLVAFARHSRAAGALMAPYLGWVTFAAAINAAVWRLNR